MFVRGVSLLVLMEELAVDKNLHSEAWRLVVEHWRVLGNFQRLRISMQRDRSTYVPLKIEEERLDNS